MSWMQLVEFVTYGRTLRTAAFLIVAGLTFISMGFQHDIYSDIVLTKFVKLDITDPATYIKPPAPPAGRFNDKRRMTAFGLYTKKETIDQLLYTWRCPNANQTIDIWGPDNMCRCLMNYEVTTDVKDTDSALEDVEKTCYHHVVPLYGKVYTGSIRGYWNFYIGLIMIHISILISMRTIEYKNTYLHVQYPVPPSKMEPDEQYVNYTRSNNSDQDQYGSEYGDNDDSFEKVYNGPEYLKKKIGRKIHGNTKNKKLVRPISKKFSLSSAFDWQNHESTADENVYLQVGQDDPTHFRWNEFYDVLILLLSVTVVVLLSFCFAKRNDFIGYKDGFAVLTLYIWSMAIAVLTLVVTFLNFFPTYSLTIIEMITSGIAGDRFKIVNYIYSCILQDLHYIAGFMLVISTFSAQSGEHDDYTIFLDVVCVLFIGFMQHISHLVMLLKEQAIGFIEDGKPGDPNRKDIRSPEYEAGSMNYIFSFFSMTRAWIFAIIGASVYVFSRRIAPTAFAHDSVKSWNNNAKFFTLLFFVSPSILFDLYYEFAHFDQMRKYQRHLEYFGPQLWRIWSSIAFIFVLFIMSMQGYGGDDNYSYKEYVYHADSPPNSNF
jgi:hypothetical protein